MTFVLFRYLHLLAVLVLLGGVIIENMAIRPRIIGEDAKNLARIDSFCGLAVACIVVFGSVLWFGVGKPATFYSTNPLFHAKLGLLGLLLLTAITPAVFFFRNRNFNPVDDAELPVPGAVRICLRIELLILLAIPVLAWLVARGVGLG